MTRRSLQVVGNVNGKRVLIYGCGYDPGATCFSRRAAVVTAIDVSPESINNQRILMKASDVSMRLEVTTPFWRTPDEHSLNGQRL